MLDGYCSGKAEMLTAMAHNSGSVETVCSRSLKGIKRQSRLRQNEVVGSRQDYAGIDRVNSSAYMLGELQRYKRRMWEPSSSYPYVAAGNTTTTPYAASDGGYPFGITAPYTARSGQGGGIGAGTGRADDARETSRWSIPTAVASANLVFSLWIPVAFGLDDPRGALLLSGAAA